MQATFAFGSDMDEAAALAAVADHRSPEDEGGTLDGSITLSSEGRAPVVLRDDLEFLVPSLCLVAPATLAAEGRVTVPMASAPRSVVLIRDGDAIRLQDREGAELGQFPAADLLAALHACAVRFTAFIGALADQFPDWRKLHESLLHHL